MNLTLIICLLFFACSSSFSISKSKGTHPKETHEQEKDSKENDIYGVEESVDSLKLSYPKPDKPTLREIIYYHVIEKPYGESEKDSVEENKSSSTSEEDDDVVETERPFTNGHGFPFLLEPVKQNDSSEEEEEAVTIEIIEVYSSEEVTEKDNENEGAIINEATVTTHEPTKPFEKLDNNHSTTPTITSYTPLQQIPDKNTPFKKDEEKKEEIEDLRVDNSTAANEAATQVTTTPSMDAKNSANEDEVDEEEEEDEDATINEATVTTHKPTETIEKLENNHPTTPTVTSSTPSKQIPLENTPFKKDEEKKEEIEDLRVDNSTAANEAATEVTTTPSMDAKKSVNKPELVKEKRNARATLFNQAREKYQNRRAGNNQHRFKRHVKAEDIPDAPTLRPLNLDSLPEYARKLISTPAPELATGKVILERPTNFNEEELQKELQERLEEIMATLKPKFIDDSNPESDESNENEAEHGKKRIARTYGMNLTEDQGYVWNDLLGDPGMFIKIGEPEEDNAIPDQHEPTDTPIKNPSSTHYSTESKPIYMENSNKKNTDDLFVEIKTNKPNNVIEHSTEKDTDSKIDPRSEKESETSITKDPDHAEPDVKDDATIESMKPYTERLKVSNDSFAEFPTIGTIITDNKKPSQDSKKPKSDDEVTLKNEKTDDGHSNTTKSSPADLKKHKEETMEEKARAAIVDTTKSEILQELLKNEQLWKWVGDWTAKYTELLMKRIKSMVHDEVGRQMKAYTAKMKNQIQKENEEALQKKEGNAVKENTHKTKDKTEESKKKDTPVIENKEANKTLDNIETNDKEDKIIIDGKVLPLTHNTNFKSDELSKRRKDKDSEKHKHPDNTISEHKPENVVSEHKDESKNNESKPSITVTAQNVYGNSAGSEKVTNIFVFYPHNDEIINDFKPFENGNQDNAFVLDKKKDDGATDLAAQKDESTSTINVPSKEVTTKTPVDNKDKMNENRHTEEHKDDKIISTEPSKDIKNNSSTGQDRKEKGSTEVNITTETTVDNKDKVTEKPHVEDNKGDKIKTEPGKDIKKSSLTEQDIKENNSTKVNITTEATVKSEETSEANKSKNDQQNKSDANSDLNKATTVPSEEIPSKNSITNKPTEGVEKDAVTTDLDKQQITTERGKTYSTEGSTITSVEKDTGVTEKVMIENKEDPLKTSPNPETKDPKKL